MTCIHVNSSAAKLKCGNCDARHTVERDEDGTASLDTVLCHVDGCKRETCATCTLQCVGCDQPTCSTHLTNYEGSLLCPCCFAHLLSDAAEAVVEEMRGCEPDLERARR